MTYSSLIPYTGRMAKHSSISVEHYTPAPVIEAARAVLTHIDLDPASCAFANELVRAEKIYTEADDGLKQEWAGRVFLNCPGGALEKPDRGTRSRAVRWWIQLVESYERDEAEAAIFVGFSLELLQSAQSFQGSQPLDFPCCVPRKRLHFDVLADDVIRSLQAEQRKVVIRANSLADQKKIVRLEERIEELKTLRGQRVSGDAPTHGNCVVYLPPIGGDATREGVERFCEAFREIGYVHVPRGYRSEIQ